jgi:hypothetical protein
VTRAQLEHLLRAAADIAEDDEIVVLGSQAILGQFPDAPAALRVSVEADLYPRNHPERTDLIDGTIGELSPFPRQYGYYAQGVGKETAVLPEGWEERLVRVQNERTRGASGLCLEAHDLIVSKAVAGREKDRVFVREAIRHRLVERDILLDRLRRTPLDEGTRERLRQLLEADFRQPAVP